jgi:tetratricopeptide (TPR) repeat protein
LKIKKAIILSAITMVFATWSLSADPAVSATSGSEKMKASKLVREATELFRAGDYEKSVPMFKQALALNPEDKVALRYINVYNQQVIEPSCKAASDLFFAGDYPRAIKQWEGILRKSPGENRVQELIEEALAMMGEKNLDSMYAAVDKLISQERFSEAAEELETIIADYPKEKRAKDMLVELSGSLSSNIIRQHYNKAGVLMDSGDYDGAVRELEAVLELNPKQELASRLIIVARRSKLEKLYTDAEKYLNEGSYTAARSLHVTIQEDNPTDTDAAETASRLDEVVKLIPDITKDSPADRAMKTSLYHYISTNGNPKASVMAAWYATQLDPRNALAMAVRDFVEQKFSSIIPQLEAPGQEMNIVDQYLFASLNYIYEGRYDLAMEVSSLVLELEPDNLLALKRLGSAYHLMGQSQKAKKVWKRALEIDPNDKDIRESMKLLR